MNSYSQFQRPSTWFNIGYHYANFGNSFAPATIRKIAFNETNTQAADKFKNARNGYGLVLRAMLKNDKGLVSEFSLWNKKVTDKASAIDSVSGGQTAISTKLRIRGLSYGLHYSFRRFTIGGSVDIGRFSSLIRYKGTTGENDGKWLPWFSTPKVLGTGFTGKTPVLGWTIAAGFAISKYADIRIFRQYTAFGLGAELSGRYFSIANWGVELAFTLQK